MAGLTYGVYFMVGVAICCGIGGAWSEPEPNGDLVEELMQRLERVEAIQRSQQHIIDQQASEIADLKHKCNKQAIDDLSTDTENTGDILNDEAEHNDASLNSSFAGHDVVEETTDGSGKPVQHTIQTRQTPELGVAFTAYLNHGTVLGQHQTVRFNQVITNEGGAYNSYTGVFTCPVDGVYMFTFFIGQNNAKGSEMEIVVNSNPYLNVIIGGYHAHDTMGGNTLIKRLVKGDVVWIDAIQPSTVTSLPDLRPRLTSFSGILMYK